MSSVDGRISGCCCATDARVALPTPRAKWVHGPLVDTALALAWVPFALAAHVLENRPGRGLSVLVGLTLVFSFTHQAPTVALVYGDPAQFRLHRRLYTWSPVAFAVAAIVVLRVSPILLAAVAGLWNAEHTLMQRYGITRIYGRKAGDDQGRLERAMLLSWLVLALVWAATDTRLPGLLARVDIGATNAQGVVLLHRARPAGLVLLGPAFAVAGGLALAWIRAERRRGTGSNPAKHLYVAATALLFVAILVDPVAGFTGYVGAHAVEYFAVVHQALGRRYGRDTTDGGVLGRVVRGRGGRARVWTLYAMATAALLAVLSRSPVVVASVVYITVGGMHVLWDGFIWKLRRAAVARSLAVPAAS